MERDEVDSMSLSLGYGHLEADAVVLLESSQDADVCHSFGLDSGAEDGNFPSEGVDGELSYARSQLLLNLSDGLDSLGLDSLSL
jgi:hypothetical protein